MTFGGFPFVCCASKCFSSFYTRFVWFFTCHIISELRHNIMLKVLWTCIIVRWSHNDIILTSSCLSRTPYAAPCWNIYLPEVVCHYFHDSHCVQSINKVPRHLDKTFYFHPAYFCFHWQLVRLKMAVHIRKIWISTLVLCHYSGCILQCTS